MTIRHAQLLDTAFATWLNVAETFADDRISDTDYQVNRVVVDAANTLCRSLIPPTYNFPASDTDTTEHIWSAMVERNEVLTIAEVAELTDEFYDFIGLGVTNGQRLTTLPSGLSRWLTPSN